jgi:8-oxo-dGTP pyrophosphatase MutT (NUDIX family)
MPMSPYVRAIRDRIGRDLLLLPAVTAVIRHGDQLLLARHRDSGLWSFVGGGVEPGEDPRAALEREVREELGVAPSIVRVIGAYGGPELTNVYPNGDEVAYVTTAYECHLDTTAIVLEEQELIETRWFTFAEVRDLRRHAWIDRVLADIPAN